MSKCSNCQCDIEESKLFLHERFCKDNIKFCDLCKEAIIKEEFEEHLLEHEKKKVDVKPEEERSNLSLQRVRSTKLQCQFCNLFLSYSELEEHENMCGSRTTKCRVCGERIVYKNLDDHILAIHGLNKSIYNEYDSLLSNQFSELSLNKNQSSYQDSLNLNNNYLSNDLGLENLTSSEQIAYALALSEQDNNFAKNKNEDKNNNKDKEKNDKQKGKKNERVEEINRNIEKNEKLEIPKKKSEKIDYDEIENEYQKQMYEEEMKNFGNN